ncbi:MAG: glycosyl transferase family 51 [Betaproteobacteria bacterium RIFCSPLOWO2_12_FULL_62_13]|nr:MAG: glycosyl transferase family 51 [Betaproteobacteria bacterium RIFCSPLOWO2_12_FULL_62_13]
MRPVPWWRRASALVGVALVVLIVLGAVQLVVTELQSSTFQARYFAGVAAKLKFWLEPGPSPSIRFPQSGPYDQRLGYSELPALLDRLRAKGYRIEAQARHSFDLVELIESGYFPPYPEKSQAGLRVLDCRGEPLFSSSHPVHVYARFNAIPPLVVNTLLFIENRELLQTAHPHRNPAVEWGRLGKAIIERGVKIFDPDYDAPGGSTLATQIEKYRHSPSGITASIHEKFRQMVSASLRAYANGTDTYERRRQIAVDYLNTVPLAAAPGHGEVNGLGDGLWAWYGADFEAVNALLRRRPGDPGRHLHEQARAFRQVLSLLIAQRRPSHFLGPGRQQLVALTDSYLRLLANAGIVPPALRDAALRITLPFRGEGGAPSSAYVRTWKGANLVRTRLVSLLETPRLYDIDRLDVTAGSTLDADLQDTVTAMLRRLGDPAYAKSVRLREPRLLAHGDPAAVLYSFTLYERGEDANLVRVQTDNFSQPFDINEGAKLELGSTAKLRALASYLDVLASLHERYGSLTGAALREVEVHRRDRLTRWVIDYLANAKDPGLAAMLEAAMERRYSADPAEQFFTGGGVHTFSNFKREDNGKVPTVREALRDSVNLAFVRLMRDIVEHHMYRAPDLPARVLEDANHPRRAAYLARFADHEGREFVRRFHRKYRGMSAEQALETLLHGVRPTPQRLSVIFRSVEPQAGIEVFAGILRERLPSSRLPDKEMRKLYERYAPQRYSLADRGYLARIHPLELWLVAYLRRHPEAGLAQTIKASAGERQAVYAWLFKTHQRNAQDVRIRTLLEMEAFGEIHRHWKRLAYPFEALVPSYATAIGVSGDRPAALAELIGIIVNGGIRYPTVRMEELHFATATPYETNLKRVPAAGEQVMKPEVAATLKRALTSVVEEGTARRLRGAFSFPDKTALVVGGKTGTGDNRFEVYGAGGRLLESRAVNRTATFAFFLGERHFGVLTAYVPGALADSYNFTSALPVQILKVMAPQLGPYMHPGSDARCVRR